MDKTLLYEGKAKRIYSISGKPDIYLQEFKNSATAFNGIKKDEIEGKGVLNNKISTIFFEFLMKNGIPTHFIEKISDNEMLVKKVSIIKVEVVCRNIAAGSLVKRYGFLEGVELRKPIIEFYYKSDEAGDPLFTESHIFELKLATENEINTIKDLTIKINSLLIDFLKLKKIKLVDFKLEFGKDSEGKIILADEISPDTCRFWDADTNKKLDKDNFRFDLGNLIDAYVEIFKRISN